MNRAMIWQQQRSKKHHGENGFKVALEKPEYMLETLPDGALDFISLSEFHEQPYSGK